MSARVSARVRLRGDEGFTLLEVLIVVAILGLIVSAVFSVYSVSQSAYLRSSGLADAQQENRVGIDRMATEMRLAGAYWASTAVPITAANATSITFRGDVNGDTVDSSGNEILLAANAASGATSITVSGTIGRDGTNPFAPGKYVYLGNGTTNEVSQIAVGYASGATIPLVTALTNAYLAGSIVRTVETVTYLFNSGTTSITRSEQGGAALTLVGNAKGMTLSYFDGSGNSLGASPTLSSIREIGISITTTGSGRSDRVMGTRVSLRNLP